MARIRSVKPEYWADRKLARLSRDARLLYIALWNQADEHERVQGDVRYIKGHCLPYDDDLSLNDIGRLLGELIAGGRVIRYVVDDDPYLLLPHLHKHQRLEPQKAASRLPAPPEMSPPDPDNSALDPEQSASRADRPGKSARSLAALNGSSATSQNLPASSSGATSDSSSDTGWSGHVSSARADFPGEAEKSVVQHVAGSMEHVAGVVADRQHPAPRRIDVEQVCTAVVAAEVYKGNLKPSITETWRTSARLMLDTDKRALADILALIEWSKDDDFWRGNIKSVPKLRKQFDTLRLQREAKQKKPQQTRLAAAVGDMTSPTYDPHREHLGQW